jgi:hypothetical protein
MRTTLFFAFSVAALAAGCGTNNTTADMSTHVGDMTVNETPTKPGLAATQIDRMGRGAINVAVTNPFNLNQTGTGMGGASRDATRLAYDIDSNESAWTTNWAPVLEQTLAIYDGADTTCGNQFGACGMAAGCGGSYNRMGANVTPATTYGTLATVLADDQLYMNTSIATCSFYLAVEANALNVAGAGTMCGGRTPLVDVVSETYTAATVGATGFPTTPTGNFAVTDGITGKAAAVPAASLTTFPFLANPN